MSRLNSTGTVPVSIQNPSYPNYLLLCVSFAPSRLCVEGLQVYVCFRASTPPSAAASFMGAAPLEASRRARLLETVGALIPHIPRLLLTIEILIVALRRSCRAAAR